MCASYFSLKKKRGGVGGGGGAGVERMVEHSSKILASEERATTIATISRGYPGGPANETCTKLFLQVQILSYYHNL